MLNKPLNHMVINSSKSSLLADNILRRIYGTSIALLQVY